MYGDRYRLAKVSRLCRISGCHVSSSCGFNRLVHKRSGLYFSSAELGTDDDRVEKREKAVRLTEAGQIPVTAILVFPSLLKSMAYRNPRLVVFQV